MIDSVQKITSLETIIQKIRILMYNERHFLTFRDKKKETLVGFIRC